MIKKLIAIKNLIALPNPLCQSIYWYRFCDLQTHVHQSNDRIICL